jgi:hypothetical protein
VCQHPAVDHLGARTGVFTENGILKSPAWESLESANTPLIMNCKLLLGTNKTEG